MLLPLKAASADRAELWETIRSAAVACGAFPFAFRVQDLARNMADFPGEFLVKDLWAGNPSRFFTYTDGGVFQNEPLGMAKNLVELLLDGHLNALSRGYCFIARQPKPRRRFSTPPIPQPIPPRPLARRLQITRPSSNASLFPSSAKRSFRTGSYPQSKRRASS